MPKIEQIFCDYCGTPKKETNRWWIAFVCSQQMLGANGEIRSWRSLRLKEFTPDSDYTPAPDAVNKVNNLYLCGEACVIKVVSAFLAQGAEYYGPKDQRAGEAGDN